MAFEKRATVTGNLFWVIDKVSVRDGSDEETFATGWATDHNNGRLTNEKLMQMSDEELQRLAFTPEGAVRCEDYKNPEDDAWCKKNDSRPGTIYSGRHRAVEILRYRQVLKQAGRR